MVAAHAAGHVPVRDTSAARQEVVRRRFGAEPDLDRVSVPLNVGLTERERLAARDPELQFDEVEPGDELGHGMFDLQARVHFHEVETAVGIEQELDRARADVTDRPRHRDRRLAHAFAQALVDGRGGRFLDDLLVAPLYRAVALAQVDDVALTVGEHLDLDVARLEQRALQDETAVAKGLGCFRGGRPQRVREGVRGRARAACRVRRRPPPPSP